MARSGETNLAVIDRIESARRFSAKELYLDAFALTEIPDWLKQLKWLRELGLRNNKLKELPEWIGDFTNLKSLNQEFLWVHEQFEKEY